MGHAFSGHCDGHWNGTPITVPNGIVVGEESNTGPFPGKYVKNGIIYAEQENNCNYQPKSTTTSLPKISVTDISKLYNSNSISVGNLTVNNSCNILPRGIIIAWNNQNIPDGWALCDGTNCTPDLRGRFIYGYDSLKQSNRLYEKGGETSHLITLNEMPTHSHRYNANGGVTNYIADISSVLGKNYVNGLNNNQHTTNTYINPSKNVPHNNMPPYVSLKYIMKL